MHMHTATIISKGNVSLGSCCKLNVNRNCLPGTFLHLKVYDFTDNFAKNSQRSAEDH